MCINFDLKGDGLHFWQYFQKLVWSPWLQVTFLLLAWERDFEIGFV
jgi:hypothetical protein